jgi:hypothetical protein
LRKWEFRVVVQGQKVIILYSIYSILRDTAESRLCAMLHGAESHILYVQISLRICNYMRNLLNLLISETSEIDWWKKKPPVFSFSNLYVLYPVYLFGAGAEAFWLRSNPKECCSLWLQGSTTLANNILDCALSTTKIIYLSLNIAYDPLLDVYWEIYLRAVWN